MAQASTFSPRGLSLSGSVLATVGIDFSPLWPWPTPRALGQEAPEDRQPLYSAAGGLGPALERVLGQEEQNLFHLVDARLVVEAELTAQAAQTRRPEDLLPLRQALTAVLAAHGDRLAFIRADEAFHLAIARVAG